MISKKCFVGIYDILGFKNMINVYGIHETYKYLDIITYASRVTSEGGSYSDLKARGFNIPDSVDLSDDFPGYGLNHQAFSDTVILYTNDDSYESFENITINSYHILHSGFTLKIPIRGGISHGEVVHNKDHSLVVGQPIIDAHICEGAQEWAGVIFDPIATAFILKKQYLAKYDYKYRTKMKDIPDYVNEGRALWGRAITEYNQAPFKINSSLKFPKNMIFAINWLSSEIGIKSSYNDHILNMFGTEEGMPESVKLKRDNTLLFMYEMAKRRLVHPSILSNI